MDTLIPTSAELAGDLAVISRAETLRPVVEAASDEIEDGRGLENDRVPARFELPGTRGPVSFITCSLREFERVEACNARRVGLGPACRTLFLHSHGKLGPGLPVSGKKAA